jgi:hypothetical protein
VTRTDPDSGKVYQAFQLTPEGEVFKKVRSKVVKDVKQGDYERFFDPSKRFDVDYSKYPQLVDTRDILAKMPKTVAEREALANNPEALERLGKSYEQGMKQPEGAMNWYHMGQLEKQYIDRYGEELGRSMFKQRFADPMAGMTGGSDPTANFLAGHWGAYMREKGLDKLPAGYDAPYPVGGRYLANNLNLYNKTMMPGGTGITSDFPKRYNFSGNFIGDPSRATIDEQMSGHWDPKMLMPPKGSYGHFERAMDPLAERYGVDPRGFQDVAWAGKKDLDEIAKGRRYVASPMIEHVNQSIERTSRLTGMRPEDVVANNLIEAGGPMYARGGPTAFSGDERRYHTSQWQEPWARGGHVRDRELYHTSQWQDEWEGGW